MTRLANEVLLPKKLLWQLAATCKPLERCTTNRVLVAEKCGGFWGSMVVTK
jgi:hypothetical protein